MIPDQPDAEEAEAILAGLDGIAVWMTWYFTQHGILDVRETVTKCLAATEGWQEWEIRNHCCLLVVLKKDAEGTLFG